MDCSNIDDLFKVIYRDFGREMVSSGYGAWLSSCLEIHKVGSLWEIGQKGAQAVLLVTNISFFFLHLIVPASQRNLKESHHHQFMNLVCEQQGEASKTVALIISSIIESQLSAENVLGMIGICRDKLRELSVSSVSVI